MLEQQHSERVLSVLELPQGAQVVQEVTTRSGGNAGLEYVLVEGRLECVVVASLGVMEATADANALTQRTLNSTVR